MPEAPIYIKKHFKKHKNKSGGVDSQLGVVTPPPRWSVKNKRPEGGTKLHWLKWVVAPLHYFLDSH